MKNNIPINTMEGIIGEMEDDVEYGIASEGGPGSGNWGHGGRPGIRGGSSSVGSGGSGKGGGKGKSKSSFKSGSLKNKINALAKSASKSTKKTSAVPKKTTAKKIVGGGGTSKSTTKKATNGAVHNGIARCAKNKKNITEKTKTLYVGKIKGKERYQAVFNGAPRGQLWQTESQAYREHLRFKRINNAKKTLGSKSEGMTYAELSKVGAKKKTASAGGVSKLTTTKAKTTTKKAATTRKTGGAYTKETPKVSPNSKKMSSTQIKAEISKYEKTPKLNISDRFTKSQAKIIQDYANAEATFGNYTKKKKVKSHKEAYGNDPVYRKLYDNYKKHDDRLWQKVKKGNDFDMMKGRKGVIEVF